MQLTAKFLALAGALSLVAASPLEFATKRDTTSITFDGRTFVNKGLVGFGRISGDAKDSYGESFGGVGSAIALDRTRKNKDGTYTFDLVVQPDRGHNTQTQTDYRARQHKVRLSFDPAQGSATQENINTTYVSTLLYQIKTTKYKSTDPRSRFNFTTGLDPTAVQPATAYTPALPLAPSDRHVAVDAEGLVLGANGQEAWVSDEYGPYLYRINRATGVVITTIQPPEALLPRNGDGQLNFTSNGLPSTGRPPNQGFEGLTLDRNTNTLWALLQSATAQDGAVLGKTANRHSRLLGYDISKPYAPVLVAEYVVPLPQSGKGNTRAASEVHVVDETTFLVLARDGNGFGDTSSDSSFKNVDLISTKGATNIANTQYDLAANPISPGGVLDASITPVGYSGSFVNLIAKSELAKFGLQVGGAFDRSLVAGKLESLALAPVGDASNPDDYFLVVVSDNDFITTQGAQAGEGADGSYVVEAYSDPYAEQYGTADTQIYIWRVTLPGYAQRRVPN